MMAVPAVLDAWRLFGNDVPEWVPALSVMSKGIGAAWIWSLLSLSPIRLFFAVSHKVEIQRLRSFLRADFARGFPPCVLVELREMRIAFHILLNLGDVKRIHQRYGLPIKLGTTHDKNLLVSCTNGNRFLQRVRDEATFDLQDRYCA